MKEGSKRLLSDLADVFLNNKRPAINDVTLISSDGKEFPSCRCLLAARAPFFEKLLKSGLQGEEEEEAEAEAEQNTNDNFVKVSMRSGLLKYVLEYLVTGDICIFRLTININLINEIIDLTHASDSINCDSMYNDCIENLLMIATEYPAFTCYVIEKILCKESNRDHGILFKGLINIIKKFPVESMRVSRCLNDQHCKEEIHLQNDELDKLGITNFHSFGVQFLSFESFYRLFSFGFHLNFDDKKPFLDNEYFILIVHHWIYQQPFQKLHYEPCPPHTFHYNDYVLKTDLCETNVKKEVGISSSTELDQSVSEHSFNHQQQEQQEQQEENQQEHQQDKQLHQQEQHPQNDSDVTINTKMKQGKELLDLVNLNNLRPSFLHLVVEPMHLLSLGRLCGAYRYHALTLANEQSSSSSSSNSNNTRDNGFICNCFIPTHEVRRTRKEKNVVRVVKVIRRKR